MLDRLVWLNLAVPSLVYRPIGQSDITAVLGLAAGRDAAAGSGIAQRIGTLWLTGPIAAACAAPSPGRCSAGAPTACGAWWSRSGRCS